MNRIVKVSTVQPRYIVRRGPINEAISKNVNYACKFLQIAGEKKSDVVLLPEIFNVAGIRNKNIGRYLEDTKGETVKKIGEIARRYRMNIIASMLIHENSKIRNSAIFINREGKVVGVYFKVHPTQVEKIEQNVIHGDRFNVFQLDFGSVGAMICHDNSFVESARCLKLAGAEIIFWPHLQSGWGDIVWDITLRSRAIDNEVYIVSSSFSHKVKRCWNPGLIQGRSGIVGKDGFIITEVGRDEGVATAEIDLNQPRITRYFTRPGAHRLWQEMKKDRRPQAYRIISKTEDKFKRS